MSKLGPNSVLDIQSATPQNILVRGVNWLGDAVMATPALQRLREAKPDARITLLTPEKLSDLWQNHPALDKVLTFSSKATVFQVARLLRGEQFATALVLPNSHRSALEMFLAHIPERLGYSQPWRNVFLTHSIPPRAEAVIMRKRTAAEVKRLIRSPRKDSTISAKAHHIFHYLHLVSALGAKPEPLAPYIAVSDQEVAQIKKRFGFAEGQRSLLFGLNAGAEYGPAKRWPRERFIAAARELQRQTNCQWWIFGTQDEQPLATSIAIEIKPIDQV